MLSLAFFILAAEPAVWEKEEAAYLKNIKQVTRDFVRAGEGYFAPDGKTIIFQAEEKDTGNPFYQIFTQDLATGQTHRVSPGVGKTTCAYFRPDGKKVIFASSHLDPDAKKRYAEEYSSVGRGCEGGPASQLLAGISIRHYGDFRGQSRMASDLKRLTHAKGYNAEGSYSPDGKQIVFCSNRGGAKNFELYIMDSDGKNVRQLTKTPMCYNGGPILLPDGKRVIFRSDRKEYDSLQLFVINVDGSYEPTP